MAIPFWCPLRSFLAGRSRRSPLGISAINDGFSTAMFDIPKYHCHNFMILVMIWYWYDTDMILIWYWYVILIMIIYYDNTLKLEPGQRALSLFQRRFSELCPFRWSSIGHWCNGRPGDALSYQALRLAPLSFLWLRPDPEVLLCWFIDLLFHLSSQLMHGGIMKKALTAPTMSAYPFFIA